MKLKNKLLLPFLVLPFIFNSCSNNTKKETRKIIKPVSIIKPAPKSESKPEPMISKSVIELHGNKYAGREIKIKKGHFKSFVEFNNGTLYNNGTYENYIETIDTLTGNVLKVQHNNGNKMILDKTYNSTTLELIYAAGRKNPLAVREFLVTREEITNHSGNWFAVENLYSANGGTLKEGLELKLEKETTKIKFNRPSSSIRASTEGVWEYADEFYEDNPTVGAKDNYSYIGLDSTEVTKISDSDSTYSITGTAWGTKTTITTYEVKDKMNIDELTIEGTHEKTDTIREPYRLTVTASNTGTDVFDVNSNTTYQYDTYTNNKKTHQVNVLNFTYGSEGYPRATCPGFTLKIDNDGNGKIDKIRTIEPYIGG